jgi:hypothetical protein
MNHADWPFADLPNLAVITTSKVLEEGHPILLVTHDADYAGDTISAVIGLNLSYYLTITILSRILWQYPLAPSYQPYGD